MPDTGHYGIAVAFIGVLFALIGTPAAVARGWYGLAMLFSVIGVCAIIVGGFYG